MPMAPLTRGHRHILTIFDLPVRLLLVQLPLQLVDVPLQLANALTLAFLQEAPDKEKQEEHYKSDDHFAQFFLFNEQI